MKNFLTLHEAIAVVLLGKPNRTATFQEIANIIEGRKLFEERKGGITMAKQVELRCTKSKGRYFHLFHFIPPDKIKLK